MEKIFALFVAVILIGCSSDKGTDELNYADGSLLEPTLFGQGVISTPGASEFDLTFTPDGKTVYFTRRLPNEKQKIYTANWVDGKWSAPTLATFSTDRDEAPYISPNGELFFFGSERPISNQPNLGNFDMNVWMMRATEAGWSAPEPIGAPINAVQEEGEEWPSSNNNLLFTHDNSTYYFTTMLRGTKAVKLYSTTYDGTSFSAPVEVSGLFDDEQFWIYSAVLSPDGEYLIFNSYGAPGGVGGEDIYVSKRVGSGWSAAKGIGALINSTDEESSPRFSRDGKYFFFSRAANLGNFEYGEWDIYIVETSALNLAALFE